MRPVAEVVAVIFQLVSLVVNQLQHEIIIVVKLAGIKCMSQKYKKLS
jgi:hypothetical protein